MLRPSRFSFYLALAITAASLWLWRQDAAIPRGEHALGRILIYGVSVFDPQRLQVMPDQDVLIVDGVIRSVTPAQVPTVFGQATQISGKGMTLLPALIDVAVFGSLDGSLPQDRRQMNFDHALRIHLAAGLGTVFNLNNSRAQILDFGLQRDLLRLPRLRMGAAVLTGRGGWRTGNHGDGGSPAYEISDIEELEQAFAQNRKDGATLAFASVEHSARETSALSHELLLRLGELCKSTGIPLVIHAESPAKALAALAAKPNVLLGPWAGEVVSQEFLTSMLSAQCALAPALQSLLGFLPPHEIVAGLRSMSEANWLAPSVGQSLGDWPSLLRHAKKVNPPGGSESLVVDNVRRAHEAGIPVVLGSMSGMPGLPHGAALRAELGRLADAGLGNANALRAATYGAAKAMGEEKLGRVAPGFKADLLLVAGDPVKDLNAVRKIALVIRAGKIWKADELAKP